MYVENWRLVFRYASGQTDKHADTLIGGEITTLLNNCQNKVCTWRTDIRKKHANPKYTVSKNNSRLLVITSANVYRFSKLLRCQISKETLYELLRCCLSHLNYVATLPCETWKLQLQPISMAYIACIAKKLWQMLSRKFVWFLWRKWWNILSNLAYLLFSFFFATDLVVLLIKYENDGLIPPYGRSGQVSSLASLQWSSFIRLSVTFT